MQAPRSRRSRFPLGGFRLCSTGASPTEMPIEIANHFEKDDLISLTRTSRESGQVAQDILHPRIRLRQRRGMDGILVVSGIVQLLWTLVRRQDLDAKMLHLTMWPSHATIVKQGSPAELSLTPALLVTSLLATISWQRLRKLGSLACCC
jgi:hypothetical protein